MPIIINKESRLITIGAICSLTPGGNEVGAEQWADAKKIALVKHLIESGTLVEQNVTGIKDLKPEDATKIIKETHNLDTLKRWREGEQRQRVTAAIDAQIAFLTDATKKASEEK